MLSCTYCIYGWVSVVRGGVLVVVVVVVVVCRVWNKLVLATETGDTLCGLV